MVIAIKYFIRSLSLLIRAFTILLKQTKARFYELQYLAKCLRKKELIKFWLIFSHRFRVTSSIFFTSVYFMMDLLKWIDNKQTNAIIKKIIKIGGTGASLLMFGLSVLLLLLYLPLFYGFLITVSSYFFGEIIFFKLTILVANRIQKEITQDYYILALNPHAFPLEFNPDAYTLTEDFAPLSMNLLGKAIFHERIDIIEKLILARASLSRSCLALIEYPRPDNMTPVMISPLEFAIRCHNKLQQLVQAQRNYLEIISLLVKNGADVNYKSSVNGQTLLERVLAAESVAEISAAQIKLAKILIFHGADINVLKREQLQNEALRQVILEHYANLKTNPDNVSNLRHFAATKLYEFLYGGLRVETSENIPFSLETQMPTELLAYYKQTPQRLFNGTQIEHCENQLGMFYDEQQGKACSI